MRGSLVIFLSSVLVMGIIPAGAGLTAEEEKPKTAYWDHPRGCGAHFITNAREKWYEGSSPRVRGSLGAGRNTDTIGRIIPAGAGFTFWIAFREFGSRDHPRGCGAH